jgi:hypothetical protein
VDGIAVKNFTTDDLGASVFTWYLKAGQESCRGEPQRDSGTREHSVAVLDDEGHQGPKIVGGLQKPVENTAKPILS